MTYAELGAVECGAKDTAKFIDKVDKLFDTFNSKVLYCKLKPHKAAISTGTDHVRFLNGCLSWFGRMKFLGTKTNLPCIEGWKQSISALLGLWQDISQDGVVGFLLTDRLNLDCLQNLFAVIRQAGMCRDNPNAFEFGAAFNHAMVNRPILLRPPPNSNCASDSDTVIATLSLLSNHAASLPVSSNSSFTPVQAHAVPSVSTDCIVNNVTSVISSLPAQNTLCYIAGYVAN